MSYQSKKIKKFFGVDSSDGKKGVHRIFRIESKSERRKAEKFVNRNHSYIDWSDRPSRKMYWSLYEDEKMVGVFGLGSAFDKPGDVQSFMKKYGVEFNELGNNIVFCLNGHEDRNAGTKLLSLIRRDAKNWWKERYNDELKAIQTFILPPRTGSVYKADNWKKIGETSGKGTIVSRTLYGDDREKYKDSSKVEIREFNNGETKWILREFKETKVKLIFVYNYLGW